MPKFTNISPASSTAGEASRPQPWYEITKHYRINGQYYFHCNFYDCPNAYRRFNNYDELDCIDGDFGLGQLQDYMDEHNLYVPTHRATNKINYNINKWDNRETKGLKERAAVLETILASTYSSFERENKTRLDDKRLYNENIYTLREHIKDTQERVEHAINEANKCMREGRLADLQRCLGVISNLHKREVVLTPSD